MQSITFTKHWPSCSTRSSSKFENKDTCLLSYIFSFLSSQSNPHQEIQRQELLTIYQWFSLNKPLATPLVRNCTAKLLCLISTQIKRMDTPKPQVFLTKSKAHQSLDIRPQTAPAVIRSVSRNSFYPLKDDNNDNDNSGLIIELYKTNIL